MTLFHLFLDISPFLPVYLLNSSTPRMLHYQVQIINHDKPRRSKHTMPIRCKGCKREVDQASKA